MSKSVEDLASLQQQQDEKLKTSKPNASSPKGFSLTSSMESMSSTAKLGKTEETQENLLKHMWKGHKDDSSIKTQKGEITTSPHKFDDKELSILKLSLGSAYKKYVKLENQSQGWKEGNVLLSTKLSKLLKKMDFSETWGHLLSQEMFEAFAASEFNLENLVFMREVETFQKKGKEDLSFDVKGKALRIYNKFVKASNISSKQLGFLEISDLSGP